MNTKILGDKGEIWAQNYLVKQGYIIIENNYHSKIGEIDIIAKQGEEIVFVEVKTRSSDKFGKPSEAVNFQKQFKIKKTAEVFLLKSKKYYSKVRFDVIEVYPDEKIVHLKNCF